MKDFPLDELLAATDLEKIQDAIYLIFAHINKKLSLKGLIPSDALSLWSKPSLQTSMTNFSKSSVRND